jgi:hypothetical protein
MPIKKYLNKLSNYKITMQALFFMISDFDQKNINGTKVVRLVII